MINQDPTTIRALAALTASYVPATVVESLDASQLYVYATYTKGDETNASLKVEYSPDGTIWGQETFESISSGTATSTLGEHVMAATGVYVFQIPNCAFKTRISVKATGGSPTGTMKLDVQEGND